MGHARVGWGSSRGKEELGLLFLGPVGLARRKLGANGAGGGRWGSKGEA